MHAITDSLLVGNIGEAQDPPRTIGSLLLVADEFEVHPPPWIQFLRIPFKEFAAAEAANLQQAVDWIEGQISNGRVIVCCRAGMGRSVSVVIAYLCCVQHMTYEEAVKLAMARRPGAMPLPKLSEAIEQVQHLRQRPTRSTPTTGRL
ncbi:MAG: dual specificity protein phosphatase family protein [Nitrospiraceae bacterium]